MEVIPLTERVLKRLGPPRVLWMLLWAGLLVTEYVAAHLAKSPVYSGLEYSIAGVYVALFALWGIGVMARRVAALQPDLERLLGSTMAQVRPFARLNSVWGPLLLTLVTSSLWFAELVAYPTTLTVLLTPLSLLGWIPANVAVWVIGIILWDLHRLGGQPLQLSPFEEDLGLGLHPLGGLAVTAFAMVSAGIVPLLIASSVDVTSFVAVLGQYVVIILLFVLSLWRLHRRMLGAKGGHRAEAQTLYAHALRDVKAASTQDTAKYQAAAWLGAAEVIDRRAAAIHEWPFDAGMLRQVVAILSAVLTGILAQVILNAIRL